MEIALDVGRHGAPGVDEAEGELEGQGREEDSRRAVAGRCRFLELLHLPIQLKPPAVLAALTGLVGGRAGAG